MRFLVSDHAYTRAWSRSLFKALPSIRNRADLEARFQAAFTRAERFYFAKGPKAYKCHDGQLNYVFFIHPGAAVLATVYPVKGRMRA